MLIANESGSVHLYHNNSEKFATSSAGVTVTGNVTIGSVDTSVGAGLNIGNESPTIQLFDTTNDAKLLMYTQDSSSIIGTYSNHPLAFYTNSTLALTLDTSQNATFAGQVEVALASNQIKLSTGTAGDGYLNIGHFANGSFIGTYGDDGGAADLIRFGTHSGDERMRIDSSGNVAIGSSSADGKLDITQSSASDPVSLIPTR